MNKVTVLGAAIAVAAIYLGAQAFGQLSEKAKLQLEAKESVARWKQSARALDASHAKWVSQYPSLDSYGDLLAVARSLNLAQVGLAVDYDKLSLKGAEEVTAPGGQSLQMRRLCLRSNTTNGAGLEVSAASYGQLLTGIQRIAARPSIFIGGMSINGDGVHPTATLTDFCVLVRQEVA